MSIRNEEPEDYRTVEELIKKTFWNLSVPGCNEHYLVHQIRKSEEYIPELDFVLEEDGKTMLAMDLKIASAFMFAWRKIYFQLRFW